MDTKISTKPAIIASILLLLLAIFPLPYGFYTLLRILVCLTAGFLAWFCYGGKKIKWAWIMGFIALLFNPLIPISLGKGLWVLIDLTVAIVFGVFLKKFST